MSYTQAEHQHQAIVDVLAALVKPLAALTTNTGLISGTLDRINESLDASGETIAKGIGSIDWQLSKLRSLIRDEGLGEGLGEIIEGLQGISASINYQGNN